MASLLNKGNNLLRNFPVLTFKEYLSEAASSKFEIGDWVYHETSDTETWGQVTGLSQNGNCKLVAFTSWEGAFNGKATQISMNALPLKKIQKSDVPEKALKKIEARLSK